MKQWIKLSEASTTYDIPVTNFRMLVKNHKDKHFTRPGYVDINYLLRLSILRSKLEIELQDLYYALIDTYSVSEMARIIYSKSKIGTKIGLQSYLYEGMWLSNNRSLTDIRIAKHLISSVRVLRRLRSKL